MSRRQAYIQALHRVIRHWERELTILQGLVEQLRQDDGPEVIFVEAKAIFDDRHVHFVLPPCLLAQELELDAQEHLLIIPIAPDNSTGVSSLQTQGAGQESRQNGHTDLMAGLNDNHDGISALFPFPH